MTQKVLVNRSRSDKDSLYSLMKGSSFSIAAMLDLSEQITVVCITSLLRETDTGTEGRSCRLLQVGRGGDRSPQIFGSPCRPVVWQPPSQRFPVCSQLHYGKHFHVAGTRTAEQSLDTVGTWQKWLNPLSIHPDWSWVRSPRRLRGPPYPHPAENSSSLFLVSDRNFW